MYPTIQQKEPQHTLYHVSLQTIVVSFATQRSVLSDQKSHYLVTCWSCLQCQATEKTRAL